MKEERSRTMNAEKDTIRLKAYGLEPTVCFLSRLPSAFIVRLNLLFISSGHPAVDPLTARHLSLIIGAVLILVVARFLRQ